MHRMHDVPASRPAFRGLALAALTCLALASTAAADVTMKQRTVSSGLGGFGNGTSEETIVISGDKARADDARAYTGRFKTIAGGGKAKPSASITRLDRDLIWMVDFEKEQYTELSFAEMRQAMAEGAAEMDKAMKDAKREQQKSQIDVEYSIDVKRTGRKETVNGFAAENVLVTLTATARDKDKGGSGNYTIEMDQWLAPTMPGQDQINAYYRRYAEKMGMDPAMRRMAGAAMSQYGEGMKRITEKMKDLKGYPVRSTMKIKLLANLNADQKAELEKAKTGADKAKANAKTHEEKEDAEANASAVGSLAKGNIGGALGGFLGRKAGKAAENKAAENMSSKGGDDDAFMTVTTDVISVSTAPAAGVSFEVPAGYKKVERKGRSLR